MQAIIKKFKAIKLTNLNLIEEQNLLIRQLKTKNYCNELLITKIKHKIKNKALEETGIVDDILCFPLLIEEDQCTNINSIIFFEQLISFFKYSINKKKVDFQYSSTENMFTVHLSKESFYQLTFSLIFNVLYLLGNASSLTIKFQVRNSRLIKLIIKYTGFTLNEEQIRNYTEQHSQGEIFLLNMRYTMKGLKHFGINWDIENKGNDNILQFNFQDMNQNSKFNEGENKIISLRNYYNK